MTQTVDVPDDFSLEDAIERIRTCVADLEKGTQPLDQSIKSFGTGIELIAQCRAYIDQAELQVRELMPEDSDR